MTLMLGRGPFGQDPAGQFNFEPPPPGMTLYLEPSPKRVRVMLEGETIADSRRAMLLHESGAFPIYYLPPQDVRADVLEPSDHTTHCPKKGDAAYHSLHVGDRVVENGAWYYPELLPGAPPGLRGLIAFYADRVDEVLEEDEPVRGHLRDPYHRIDTLPTSRHIRISLNGELLAESRDAVALFETGLAPRWYVPRSDVRAELLPSETRSVCPYKGEASYHSLALDGGEDLVWYYPSPLAEAAQIADLVCFYDEKVDVELDGQPQPK